LKIVSLVSAITVFVLSSVQPAYAGKHQTPLAEAFAPHFKIGAAVSRAQIMGNEPEATRLVLKQFNTLTPENVMKWEKIEPLENQFDWEAADTLVDFAGEHAIQVAGHVLVWHQQTPDWVFKDVDGNPASRELLLSRMENHINTVVGRYRGRVHSWEVVNEALEEDGSLRQTPWLEIIGDDYIDRAFEFAHAADPGALLYYNDYNLFKPEKAAGARKLIQGLQERGLAIHGAGMQGHYGLDNPRHMTEFNDAISRFGDMGLEVYITEMDLSVLPFPPQEEWGADISINLELNELYNPFADGISAEAEDIQARQYAKLFQVLVANRQTVSRVTFWGVTDAHSWKNDWPMQGRTDYPLLFGRDFKPKPVFYRVTDLSKNH